MISYAVCQIGGKQYKVVPDKPFDVESIGEAKEIEVKVLLLSKDNSLEVGKPFLKDGIKLTCLDSHKGKKIRVAKYHPKANTRRVRGYRSKLNKVVWSVKTS